MAVGGQLNAIFQAGSQIADEGFCALGRAKADQVIDRQLGIGIQRNPHVQTSPYPRTPSCSGATFLWLDWQKLQISSHCTRFALTLRIVASWYSAQAFPASIRSFVMVLIETPVTRVIARMPMPSTSNCRICARFSIGRTFMATPQAFGSASF